MTTPNILLLHCHDLGRFLGCYGVPTVRTPHLDALAADGVRFGRAFCTAPQCSPSRASLFTGRYPHSNGVMGLTHAEFAWELQPDERHIAQELRDAGYRTAMVGVMHEDRTTRPAETNAARLGFDTFLPGATGPADDVARAAVEQLEVLAGQDEPFYLQVGFLEPHRLPSAERDRPDYMGFLGNHVDADNELGVTVPGYLHDDEGARAEIAELQGAVRYLDAAVGQVLTRLRELGVDDDTITVFTTDHGLALPRAKCNLYDPGLEVALIVRFPRRHWVGGRVHQGMVSNLDVFPTLLETLGLGISDRVQGRSLRALLDGGTDARRYRPRSEIFGEITYHSYYDPRRCVRTDRHKLIVNFSSSPAFMDSSQSWRPRSTPKVGTLGSQSHPPVELYDLGADPYELVNVADEPRFTQVKRELLERLHTWMTETNDPLLAGGVAGPLHHRSVALLSASA